MEAEDYMWVPLTEATGLPIDSYTEKAIVKYLERASTELGGAA